MGDPIQRNLFQQQIIIGTRKHQASRPVPFPNLGAVRYPNQDVLVVPRRVVPRFKDLTSDEVTDMFQSAHEIAKVIEREFHGESLTITIQDGAQAGQSVPHVFVFHLGACAHYAAQGRRLAQQ